uniref:double-strand break repair helicase AddA n=1 Tax=Pararhizobium sp. IMCC3301 TaxID=3067904 RepID=UPI0027407584|nr:double-strand break repair helicase AddA [Pararhizobium sp. IMCC3301]
MSSLPIPEDTRQRQRLASDPGLSAWVSANAGSGKTYVLSRRVIRLLLAGNDPACILCLTFTKAAASEMANRVFAELARWTVLDDADLKQVLEDLGEQRIRPRTLNSARQLFARALETPGGLKVQTIHAFCERLLQQFPLEANVPGHFEVADDEMQSELLGSAKNTVLQRAIDEPGSPLAEALICLIDASDDETIDGAINELLRKRDLFIRYIASRSNGVADHQQRLRENLGLSAQDTLQSLAGELRQGVVGGFSRDQMNDLLQAAQGSAKKSDIDVATRAVAALQADGAEAEIEAWLAVFCTKAHEPRGEGRFVTQSVQLEYPDIYEDVIAVLQVGLTEVRNRLNALKTCADTAALFSLAGAIIEVYLHLKNRRGLLDYNDLITKTERLLSRSDAAMWVQYKLDRGLSHILVDEAQDTSPAQWRVVEALSDAFFQDPGSAIRSAGDGPRTLFAVGDEKQSIYSFQGAAPDAFDTQRRRFERQARDAQLPWQNITLNLSFRSTNDVLTAVDKVFAPAEMAASVSRMGVDAHQAYRSTAAGEVRLWPLIGETTQEITEDWRLPVDRPPGALDQLAGRIAADIAASVRNDGLRPGDFLILLKKRSQIMGLINKALKNAGLPAAGMDRLALTDHIAVKDLLCLGNAMLLPQDDLTVATLLKSPFFDFTDDDLIALAAGRSGTVLEALRQSAMPCCQAAHEQILQWLSRVDFETPYRFFARILAVDGGRRKLLTRLGGEAEDLIDEFLAQALSYETTVAAGREGAGLQGFIHWIGHKSGDIKRQMDAARDEVRVMTVHGAKGLEAPIVYLVDDGSQPRANIHRPKIFVHWPQGAEGEPVLFWGAAATKDRTDLQRLLLERSDLDAMAEYRRLLYVGMTRAGDRLIICGKQGKQAMSQDNWYRLVETALKPGMTEVEPMDGAMEHLLWRVSAQQTALQSPDRVAMPAATAPLPAWISTAPQAGPAVVRALSPSRLDAERERAEEISWEERFGALGSSDSSFALQRGQAVHTLLQHLPALPADARKAAALSYLAQALPSASPAGMADEIAHCVLNILATPRFSFIFGPDARAEVAVAGQLLSAQGRYSVSGKIDRLCRTDDGMLIVDFKTNARVPRSVADMPAAYINQLAAYRALLRRSFPDMRIEAAILWVTTARLDMLQPKLLDATEAVILDKSEIKTIG